MVSARNRKNRIVVNIGVKGSGKTLTAREHFFERAERAVVVDAMQEYERGCVVSGHQETLDYLCGTNRFRVIYRPLEEADFRFICRVVWKAQNCLLVVEEVGRYCDTHSLPDEFDELISRGRHRRIDLVCTAQRFQQVHKNLTAMADEYYLFRQFEANDVEEIERRFGPHVGRVVRELDDLEAVHIRVKTFRAHDPKSFRMVHVVPGVGLVQQGKELQSV